MSSYVCFLYRADGVDGPQEMEKNKQQPSMLPGPAVPGSCLASFHFLWAIHPIRPVEKQARERGGRRVSSSSFAPGRREELHFSRRSFIPFSFRAGNEITGCAEKAWPHSTTHICLTQVCSAGSNVDDGLFLATVSYAHLLVVVECCLV